MTVINPTQLDPSPPDLSEVFERLKRDILKNLNCCKVATVVSFNPGVANQTPPTLNVKIAQQVVTSVAPDGTKTFANYPVLENVPVWFMGGGGFSFTFPIAAGNECMLLFHDRDLDSWYFNGAGNPPNTPRLHDITDAIALVGLKSGPNALGGISTTSAQIRSDDGQTYIDFTSGKIQIVANEVVVHSRNKLCYDADGTGTVITPSLITNYTQGVTQNSANPTPPEVPT